MPNFMRKEGEMIELGGLWIGVAKARGGNVWFSVAGYDDLNMLEGQDEVRAHMRRLTERLAQRGKTEGKG